jgi:D-alanyl-D-alanine carboxypeptidase
MMIRRVIVALVTAALLVSPTGAAASSSSSVAAGPGEPSFATTLRPLLEAKMKSIRIPGAVVYVQSPDKGTWKTALGAGDLGTNAPMRLDDHFRIRSITKTFTGTVILQLVDEGKLKLDNPVAKYQPEVPNGANITVRELLNMTSGLFNYTEDKGFIRCWTPIRKRSTLRRICLRLPFNTSRTSLPARVTITRTPIPSSWD